MRSLRRGRSRARLESFGYLECELPGFGLPDRVAAGKDRREHRLEEYGFERSGALRGTVNHHAAMLSRTCCRSVALRLGICKQNRLNKRLKVPCFDIIHFGKTFQLWKRVCILGSAGGSFRND